MCRNLRVDDGHCGRESSLRHLDRTASYGLCSYGLYSYGLCTYGLYSLPLGILTVQLHACNEMRTTAHAPALAPHHTCIPIDYHPTTFTTTAATAATAAADNTWCAHMHPLVCVHCKFIAEKWARGRSCMQFDRPCSSRCCIAQLIAQQSQATHPCRISINKHLRRSCMRCVKAIQTAGPCCRS